MGHTPGPWNVEKVHYRHAVVDSAQNGKWDLIAETTSRENANLIAAAPELLEALERLITQYRDHLYQVTGVRDEHVDEFRNETIFKPAFYAIKKAKGQLT